MLLRYGMGPVDEVMVETLGLETSDVGPLTSAYVRARDADPRASYGDMIAVSEPVDVELAALLRRLPSDGIIAPGYEAGTVDVLAGKKGGRYLVLEADPNVVPPAAEVSEIGGLRMVQPRDDLPLTRAILDRSDSGAVQLPEQAVRDLLLGLIALRYTQSNAIAYVRDGMALGIGAGQQSRIDCTRLAGAKTDTWWLRRHARARAIAFNSDVPLSERVNWRLRYLDGDLSAHEAARFATRAHSDLSPVTRDERAVWLNRLDHVSLVSDGAIPFRDNIDHAVRHGVRYVAEPGDSIRSTEVADACHEHDITRLTTAVRLFHH